MLIESVDDQGYLYSVTDIFPADLLFQITSCSWPDMAYQRQQIGFNRRRQIDDNCLPFHQTVHDLIKEKLKPSIEVTCGVKFVGNEFWSLNWWLDEPGFRPAMHCDGDKPSAMQIYLLPNNDRSLGTTFFNSSDPNDVMHRFPSVCNSGYLMFNKHSRNGVRKLLWHDMECAVPDAIHRVCCYISLGSYERL
jgi:hypothetical protein